MALDREAGEIDDRSCVSPEISFWNNVAFVLKTILSFSQKGQHSATLNFTRKGLPLLSVVDLPVGGISTFKYL